MPNPTIKQIQIGASLYDVLDNDALHSGDKGVANGVATLNSEAKVPEEQLDSSSLVAGSNITIAVDASGNTVISGTAEPYSLPIATTDTLGGIKASSSVVVNAETGVATVADNSHAHTIANVTGLQDALDGKQATLTTQTAYTSKGSATKVPQITTNTLGQVTGITEVTITQPTVNDGQLTIQVNGTQKGTFTANQSTASTVNITTADLGLPNIMNFVGVSTTDPKGASGATVSGHTTWAKGDVVLYGTKEFVLTAASNIAANWNELGDEGSHALKTITITGTGALSGGGSLEANRTITHNAGSAASKSSGLYKFATDAYSHVSSVTAVEKSDITGLGIPGQDTVTTVNTTGAGNAITAISAENGQITATKGASFIPSTEKGAADGVATLDSTGKLPVSQTNSSALVAGSNVQLDLNTSTNQLTISATDTTYSDATTSTSGLMSASDKAKLDGIANSATATSVSASGTATDEVQYITINGVEKKLAGGGAVTWGSITGTLSDQTDLNTELSAKESTANKTTTVNSASTNDQYPSAKAVNDRINAKVNTKTDASVLPNNANDIKTKFRIANKGNTSGEYWYYKLITLPVDAASNYASAIISGRIGGWEANNMASINALTWNRGTTGIAATVIGGTTANRNTPLTLCDIVCYTESDTTDTIYLRTKGYFAYDIDVELYQSSALITYDGTYTTTPTGTLSASITDSTQRLDIVNGVLYVAGKEAAVKRGGNSFYLATYSDTPTISGVTFQAGDTLFMPLSATDSSLVTRVYTGSAWQLVYSVWA